MTDKENEELRREYAERPLAKVAPPDGEKGERPMPSVEPAGEAPEALPELPEPAYDPQSGERPTPRIAPPDEDIVGRGERPTPRVPPPDAGDEEYRGERPVPRVPPPEE